MTANQALRNLMTERRASHREPASPIEKAR